jgi:hypothetical protein
MEQKEYRVAVSQKRRYTGHAVYGLIKNPRDSFIKNSVLLVLKTNTFSILKLKVFNRGSGLAQPLVFLRKKAFNFWTTVPPNKKHEWCAFALAGSPVVVSNTINDINFLRSGKKPNFFTKSTVVCGTDISIVI